MFKKFFSAGLLVWVPLAITFWALESIIRWSDSLVQLLPPEFRPDALIGFHIPGIGLVLAIALILVTGIFAANVIGRWVVAPTALPVPSSCPPVWSTTRLWLASVTVPSARRWA